MNATNLMPAIEEEQLVIDSPKQDKLLKPVSKVYKQMMAEAQIIEEEKRKAPNPS